ncbi:hypothetical protein SBBP1_490012 [Burkholderiales bacterium]|nr:hypothetical protein SBBP1_490012 [Burkholderiales bacterium]
MAEVITHAILPRWPSHSRNSALRKKVAFSRTPGIFRILGRYLVSGKTVAQDPSETRTRSERFALLALPHLDAAFNLARWLVRSEEDACDVVQDSYLRAFRAFDGLRGDIIRPWLLAIVRNTSLSLLARRGERAKEVPYVEDEHDEPDRQADPELIAMRTQERGRLDAALRKLPVEFREVIVLRELQELSYREIAEVLAVPAGTVMSRLSRARSRLATILQQD